MSHFFADFLRFSCFWNTRIFLFWSFFWKKNDKKKGNTKKMIKKRGTQKVNTCFCPSILSEQFTCVPLTFYQKWNMQKTKNKQKMPLYGRSRGGPKGPTAIWKMGIFFLNKYIHKILILQLWKEKNKVGKFFFYNYIWERDLCHFKKQF